MAKKTKKHFRKHIYISRYHSVEEKLSQDFKTRGHVSLIIASDRSTSHRYLNIFCLVSETAFKSGYSFISIPQDSFGQS